MENFIAGFISSGYVVAGFFFLRFWTRTRDSLFAIFACAFWLLALSQAVVVLSGIPREERTWLYLFRLGGFALIIIGIVAKNLRGRRG